MKRLLSVSLFAVLFLSCGAGIKPFPEGRCPVVVSDRLSNPSVTSFCLDTLGRMWIGTERGLNRFNGYDYHQYFFSNDTLGLPGNYISDIALDRSGRIWVGTEDGVAVFSENNGFRRIPVHSKEKAVSQILCGEDGNIYLSMMEDFCVLDSLTGAFESRIPKIDRRHSYCQRCYLDDSENCVWSVASLEITRYDLDTFDRTDSCRTSHFVVTSTMLSNGEIWMAGRHVVSVFDTRTMSMKPLPKAISSDKSFIGQDIEFIAEADSSTVLFKTSEGQLYCYIRGEEVMMEVQPSTFRIPSSFALKTVYLDSSHRLWLASDNNGFAVRPPLSGSAYYGLESGEVESASIVSASRDSDGNIWLASLHDGLFRYEPHSGTISKARLSRHSYTEKSYYLHSNNPLVMADSSGFIWITPPDRSSIMRGRYHDGLITVKDDFHLFYPRVALCDSDGGVWIGTFNYYIHYMPKDGRELKRLQLYPSKTTQITCLLEYGSSILVGAYNEPLIMVDRKSLQTELLPISQEDYNECTPHGFFYPTSFHVSSDGSILIGTRFNGILRYDPDSSRLEKLKGSPEIDISSIEEDSKGQIWASTSNGVFVYNPEEETWYDYYSPRITEGGMYFYDRASLAETDGSILFGTSQGIIVINPAEKPAGNEGKLLFEDIRIQNKTYPVGNSKRIVLPHSDNDFAVTFAAPIFQSVDKIHYKYILEGKGDQWIDLGVGREIYFNKLPTGHYTLKVRHCMGQDDVLSESSLKIRVKPHPLLSLPCILLYIVLALFALWKIGRTRKRIMDEKRAAREAEFEMEQEKRINKMNMTFFSNISHEFRTPLTMIYGPISQLSEDSSLKGRQKGLISLVRSSIERMLSLVNQLMDISKLENSSLGLKVNRTDIVPVIENSLAIFKVNSEALGIKFNVKGLEYPLLTWFDSDKIQKIISNLLSNALKFTPKGGAISFELDEEIKEHEPFVRITISDTGIGIPEDKLESIFEKYYQIESKESAGAMNNCGTGIGLYHARNLATIHHGTLVAANRPGGGSVFTLLFPKSESAYSEEEKDYGEASVSGRFPLETVSAMNPEAISDDMDKCPLLLTVDDDPDIIRYLSNLFSGEYRFVSANSTDEALALANDTPPDIILSDVAMPGKDGFELCRAIKSDLQLCHIPVVLVTAMGAMENQVQGLEEGADAYVTKPFNPAYLKALVRSQLENRSRIRRQVNEATDSSSIEAISRRDKAFLDQVYSIMESKLSDEELDVASLAAILGISRTKFYYKMKGLTGKSPSEFFLQYKLNVARRLLNEGVLNISEIAIKTGFVSLSHFSKSFKKQFGVSPSKYTG